MYTGLDVKYPLFLSDFNGTWIFWTNFRKILKYQISLKYGKWELSFHADGQTERDDGANSRFSKFCESAWRGIPLILIQIVKFVLFRIFVSRTDGTASLAMPALFNFPCVFVLLCHPVSNKCDVSAVWASLWQCRRTVVHIAYLRFKPLLLSVFCNLWNPTLSIVVTSDVTKGKACTAQYKLTVEQRTFWMLRHYFHCASFNTDLKQSHENFENIGCNFCSFMSERKHSVKRL
jgi:hypothetical protein